MKAELTIARREFKAMMSEKSFALVLIFEILLVSSSAFLASGYGILTSPESSDLLQGSRNVIYAGLVSDTRNELALPLKQAGIAYFTYDSLTEAEKDMHDGLLDAIVVGNVHLRPDPTVLTVYLPSNTPKAGLTKLLLKRFFLNVEEKLRDVKMMIYTPDLRLLSLPADDSSPESQQFEVFLIFTIPLLFFMPAIMAGSLIIDSLTEEMESGRILNLLTAPVRKESIIVGKCLGAFAATIPHCLIWVAALSITQYRPLNPAGIVLMFTIYSVFFILCGAIISLQTRKNRLSQMAFTLLSMASIMLFSPSANASPALIQFSPGHIFTGLALGSSMLEYWWQVSVLAVSCIFALIILKKASRRL